MSVSKLPSESSTYRPDIDGLRAVSVVSVLAFHAFPDLLPGGFVGVDIFFVISGYLIGGLIYSELQAGQFSIATFYARRIRRIFPALIVVMAFTYAVGWNILYPGELRLLGEHVAGAAGFVLNFLLLGEVGYFDAESHTKPLLHLWSLAVEEQFYLVWPLVSWAAWRGKQVFLATILIFSLASFAVNVSLDASTAFYFPLSRLWELTTGVLLAVVQRSNPAIADDRRWPVWSGDVLCVAGFSLIVVAGAFTPLAAFPGWWALLPVFGSALVIFAVPRSRIGREGLSLRPLVFIGTISYPLYLWHWPLLSFAWLCYGGSPPTALKYVLLAASFVLAWLTYVLVERPIRFGVARQRAVPGLLVSVLLLGALGLVTVERGGFENRKVAELNRAWSKDVAMPTTTRTSDGSCRERYGIEMTGDEVCFVNLSRPRVLFIGDSTSMALYSSIFTGETQAAAVLVAVQSHQWERPDCVRPGDFSTWIQGKSSCQNVVRNALDILAREPSIEAVALVGVNNNPFFLNKDKVDALRRAVSDLGRKTVYVMPVPLFMQGPTVCRPRHLDLFGFDLMRDTVEACREPRATMDEVRAPQRQLVAALEGRKPGIFAYDPFPLFCTAKYCYQTDNEGVLFFLGAHANVRGSVRILKDFLPWLETLGLPGAR